MKFVYNYYRKFIIDTILNFIILLIPTIIFLIYLIIFGISIINLANIIVLITMQIFISILMTPFIFKYFKKNLPILILKIAFIITEEQFQITFFERIYIKFF